MSVAEVEAVDALVFPAGPAALLKDLLDGPKPAAPLRIPWGAWTWDTDRGWTATERPPILDR
jgi:hypothetical protein